MKKLDIGTVTLDRVPKPSVGSVIFWDSKNLTLNANFNLKEFASTLVLTETLVADATRLADQRAYLMAQEIAYNQKNVAALQECNKKIEAIQSLMQSKERSYIDTIEKTNSYEIWELIPKESLAQQILQMLSNYAVKFHELQLNTFLLITAVEEGLVMMDVLEESIFVYRDKYQQLQNDIAALETRINAMYLNIVTLRGKASLPLLDLQHLRKKMRELRLAYIELFNRVTRYVLDLDVEIGRLCGIAKQIEQGKIISAYLIEVYEKMRVTLEQFDNRIAKIEATVWALIEDLLFTINLADRIDCYIRVMTYFINGGLLKAGDKVQIEYFESGFAKIHVHWDEYPEREKPYQQCYDQNPIEILFSPPDCPPVIPPCPVITTTTTTTTTTTRAPTTTPAPQSCGKSTSSGGSGITTRTHDMGEWAGCFVLKYDMQRVPDKAEILHNGSVVATTGTLVSGRGQLTFRYPGNGLLQVRMSGANGTAWSYGIECSDNC